MLIVKGIQSPAGKPTSAETGLWPLSYREFRAAGPSVRGSTRSTAIVRTGLTGPVQPQSHPSGFAFILFVLGLSVWLNNAWLLVTLVPAVGVIAMIVIPREESFLDRNFPDQYSSYKAAVRRWF